jgi:hypothetical protein
VDETYIERAPRDPWTLWIMGFWVLLALFFIVGRLWVWLLIVAIMLATEAHSLRSRAKVEYSLTAGGFEILSDGKALVSVPYGDVLALRRHHNMRGTRAILADMGCFRETKAYPSAGFGRPRWLLVYQDEDGRDLPAMFEPSRTLRDKLRERVYRAIEETPDAEEGPAPREP